jgi:carbon monoxide dehydrogenase subunit G
MELNGEQLIAAPVNKVWLGLNDVSTLHASIPGCEEIERISDEEVRAKVMFKIGPVRARFAGKLLLSDIVPDVSCSEIKGLTSPS